MEQESSGQAAKMRILEFERKVRMEALSGCQQVKNVETQIRDAPEGGLLGTVEGEAARALRTTILNASATIVEKFSKVIRLLSIAPDANNTSGSPLSPSLTTPVAAAGNSKAQEFLASRAVPLSWDADSPLTPEDSHTPVRIQTSSPAASGSGMSDGSPALTPHQVTLDSDEDIVGNPARRRFGDASADPEHIDRPVLPKKRKYLPKYQMKQRVISTGDPANDAPPDDGYTWRKYGQKDIKESAYPRSYYRCTHKNDLGCPSIKMVQRSDEDPNFYDVTYRGHHICPPLEQRTWHFGLAPTHLAIPGLLSADLSSSVIMAPGPLQFRTALSQSQESVVAGTVHSQHGFPALKSASGLTVPPSNSQTKSSGAAITTDTNNSGNPPPNTASSPEPNQIVATRFAPQNSSASQQEQNIPAKLADLGQSRLAREDSLFGPCSNVMSLFSGRSGSVDLGLETLPVDEVQQQQRKATTFNQRDAEQENVRRKTSLSSTVQMDGTASAGSQASVEPYGERWAESEMMMSFSSGEQVTSARFTPDPTSSEAATTSQGQQIPSTTTTAGPYSNTTSPFVPVSGMEIYNFQNMYPEASEVSPPPFNMGTLDSPGSQQQMYVMDYDYGDALFYESSRSD